MLMPPHPLWLFTIFVPITCNKPLVIVVVDGLRKGCETLDGLKKGFETLGGLRKSFETLGGVRKGWF